ncbi:glycosyltransferase family 2 protein [Ravibacter arvi]|uniref:Glycosyltransferase family 2 protein n=1 Tax=Ravibacter arvi TaxID=2051041 RepID=A0ABP8LR15_9BACT
MRNELPLISVVTVVRNGQKTLEQAINSVLNQSYPNVEYIIIDGGSTDGTLDIIKGYESRLRHWTSEPDSGIYDAMNKGIEICRGELIGIVNSDDWYEPNTVELIVNRYIDEGRKNGVYYGFLKLWKDEVEHSIRRFHHNFYNEHMIQHPTWFVSKSIYQKFGDFDRSYRVAGDFELFQRFIKSKVDFFPLDAVLSNFRIGGISTYRQDLINHEYLRLKYSLRLINRYQFLKQKTWLLIKQVLFNK